MLCGQDSVCSDLATCTPLSTTVHSGMALVLNASAMRRKSERMPSIRSISKVGKNPACRALLL